MTEYDAGEAFLQIVPSFRGVAERIDAEARRWGVSSGNAYSRTFNETVRRETNNAPLGPSRQQTVRQGEQSGRTFADSFKARVDAALRSLPDVRIHADSTDAEVRIARLRTNLEQLRDQRVGIDIDTGTALATVENLRRQIAEVGRESPDVAVHIDTARATAELDRIQAEIDRLRMEDVNVDVDVDDHGSAERTAGGVRALYAALAALAPLAVPLGAALTAAFAGVLGVLGAIVAGVGVLTLGLSGVGKTVQLLQQRQEARALQSGSGGVSQQGSAERALADARYNAAQQAITSAEQVEHARQALADTERRLARQEISDAQAVAKAQRDVADAQQAVHDAREQAKRDLQDLANAQVDASLGDQQAQIDLANAQEQLNRVNADWTASAEQRKQAQLDVAKAQQEVIESHEKATRATEDNTAAQKAGVSGAPGVVAAVRRQKDAVDALRLARQKERQDAADGAREIARAEEGVTDALRNQTNQAHASAEAIASAQDAVAQAVASTAEGSKQIQRINYELAHTNPAVLAFAKFWRTHMSPVIKELKGAAAEGILPPLQRALKIMQPLFRPLSKFIGDMSHAVGGLFVDMAKAFTSPFWTRFFAFLDRHLPRWLTQFGHIFGNIITGLAGIFEQFGPIISSIGDGLVTITGKFADFGKGLSHSSGFQSFLRYVKENGPIVADFFGHLFGLLGKLADALAPLGHVMLVLLDRFTAFLAKLSPNQLLLFIGAASALVAVLGGPVIATIIAVVAGVALLAANWDKIYKIFGPIIRAVKGALTSAFDGLKKAVGYVTGALKDHHKQLEELAHFLDKVLPPIIKVFGLLSKYAFELLGRYIAFVITQIAYMVDAVNGLVDAAKAVGAWFAGPFVDFFVGAWAKITGAFSAAWNWVKRTWSKLWDGAKQIITSPIDSARKLLDKTWGYITGGFTTIWSWVKNTWSGLWSRVEDLVTAPITAARKLLGGIWDDITGTFRNTYDWVRGTFASLWDRATEVITAPIDAAKRIIGGIWGDIKSGATDFIDGISNVWTRLERILAKPINWIIQYVFDDALIKAWNVFANLPGIPHIDPIPKVKFAEGGIYPGYTPGRDVGVIGVSGGEAIMRPEWTRAVGPDYVHAANAAAREGGEHGVRRFLGGFAGGGIVDKIMGPLGDLKDKFGDNSWTQYLYQIPIGLAEKLWDVIVAAAKRLGVKIGETGANIIGSITGGLGLGSVHFGGTGTLVGGYTPSANERLADSLLGKYGWGPAQAFSLSNLWNRESGWSQYADTRVSGLDPANATVFAYGIPQARPATKLPLAGRPSDLGGHSDPLAQILWGLDYIKGRYRTPDGAWAHEVQYGWYDQGGTLEPGLTLAYNGTGQAEIVAPRRTFDDLVGGGRELHASGQLVFTQDSLDALGAFVDTRIRDANFFDHSIERVNG